MEGDSDESLTRPRGDIKLHVEHKWVQMIIDERCTTASANKIYRTQYFSTLLTFQRAAMEGDSDEPLTRPCGDIKLHVEHGWVQWIIDEHCTTASAKKIHRTQYCSTGVYVC